MTNPINLYVPVWLEIIRYVGENPGTYSPRIARSLDMSGPTVNHYVKCLIKHKFIFIKKERDKRTNNLYLTGAGHELYTAATTIHTITGANRKKNRVITR